MMNEICFCVRNKLFLTQKHSVSNIESNRF